MIAATLAALREKSRMTQGELAEKIMQRGCPASINTISRWERGRVVPDANQFLALCDVLGVEDVFQTFWGVIRLSDSFVGLNHTGRQEAKRYVQFLLDNEMYTATDPPRRQHQYIPYYDLPASAGTGTLLHSEDCEQMMVDDTVPKDATCALRVSGDSMTPRYVDGQTIFVREQEWLDVGNIGIFILNGEGYIKRYAGTSLQSLNPKYAPILWRSYDDLRIFGKVIS